MTRQTFPEEAIWANSAPEVDDPDADLYAGAYESGAGKTPPKAGVHNYLFRRSDLQHQHIERNGMPRWDARTPYELGGWCLGSDGMLYRSKVAGNVNHNPVGGDGTWWRSMASISLERVYPVGSAVMRPTNPGAAESAGGLGFGTWVNMAGRSPIGAGTYEDGNGEERTFNAGSSYGEFSHTLTESEMPAHSHSLSDGLPDFGSGDGDRVDSVPGAANVYDGAPTSEVGGDEAHNTLHPTFAVTIWYRTA